MRPSREGLGLEPVCDDFGEISSDRLPKESSDRVRVLRSLELLEGFCKLKSEGHDDLVHLVL